MAIAAPTLEEQALEAAERAAEAHADGPQPELLFTLDDLRAGLNPFDSKNVIEYVGAGTSDDENTPDNLISSSKQRKFLVQLLWERARNPQVEGLPQTKREARPLIDQLRNDTHEAPPTVEQLEHIEALRLELGYRAIWNEPETRSAASRLINSFEDTARKMNYRRDAEKAEAFLASCPPVEL